MLKEILTRLGHCLAFYILYLHFHEYGYVKSESVSYSGQAAAYTKFSVPGIRTRLSQDLLVTLKWLLPTVLSALFYLCMSQVAAEI